MIEIKDVTKSYGRQKVLQNVSFEIMEGELLDYLDLMEPEKVH